MLEVAAAGGHNLLMIGPPGSGKSMLAARLPGLLPPLEADEALEATMVRSLAGETGDGKLSLRRSFRDPHHSATLQALVGGGHRARPGEVSLAHHGVLFLDELPEFNRATLEGAEAADGNRSSDGGTRQRARDLSGAVPDGGCNESVPLRPELPPRPALRARVSGQAVGPAARPHRSLHRRASGRGRRSRLAAAGRKFR